MRERILFCLVIFLAFILRLYKLGEVPLSLYWDEASLGYNAYSVAQSLRDEHGEFLPLARFIAFGDYKPPGYIYAAVPFVKILGLNEVAVRLPSAVAGALLVAVAFFLGRELSLLSNLSHLGKKNIFPLLSALFVAISPWSLLMSRAAFEANLATFFSGAGVLLFLRSIRTKSYLSFAFCALSFALSLYTFNSHRVFVPLLMTGLAVIFWKEILRDWKIFLLSSFFFFLLILPLLPHLLSREGSLRFQEVAWVNDLAPIELSNARMEIDGNVWWAKLIHNRRIAYGQQFLAHYLDHFKAGFLFFSGDVNPKLSTQTVGQLYWLDLPFLLLGLYFLLRTRNKVSAVLFIWLFLAPVPAALARETPHALRILQVLPVPQIVAALGVVFLSEAVKSLKFLKLAILGGFSAFFFFYLHDYYIHYAKTYALDWQYGYKQAVEYTESVKDQYDFIKVTNRYGRPYIYFLFYGRYPPDKYWQTKKTDRDWFGFWTVRGFDKYIFDGAKGNGRGLYVAEPEATGKEAKILQTISSPTGEVIFNIFEN